MAAPSAFPRDHNAVDGPNASRPEARAHTPPTGIRDINQLRILRLLSQNPGLSRHQVAQRTGLAKATVSQITNELFSRGLLREIDEPAGEPTVGRPPTKLEFTVRRLTIGIEITGSQCTAALTDLHARTLRIKSGPLETPTVPAVVGALARQVRQLSATLPEDAVIGIGVAVPGIVGSARSTVRLAENLGWEDVPLGQLLAGATGVPVTLINRTNAGALAEYRVGSGRGATNLVYASLNVGIGAGVIIDGQLYEGATGCAGELGHITVDRNGERCRCGNRGCLELVAALPAILRSYNHPVATAPGHHHTASLLRAADELRQRANAGDAGALAVVQQAARYFGLAVAQLANAFNPDTVVIDSPLLKSDTLFLPEFTEALADYTFPVAFSGLKTAAASFGARGGAIGAAMFAIDEALASGRVRS